VTTKIKWIEQQTFKDYLNKEIDKHKWLFMDFGPVKIDGFGKRETKYLLFRDNQALIINKEFETIHINIKNLKPGYTYGGDTGVYHFYYQGRRSEDVILTNSELKKINEYTRKFRASRKSNQKQLEVKLQDNKTRLLENKDTFTILQNFLKQYLYEYFKDLELFCIQEDDLLSDIFSQKKEHKLSLNNHIQEQVENDFTKLLTLFIKKEHLDPYFEGKVGFLLILKVYRELAVISYSKEFHDEYHGYFPNLETSTLDNCYRDYFSIDFINHTEIKNIGLLTCFLLQNNKIKTKKYKDPLTKAFETVKEKIMELDKNKELNMFEAQLLQNSNDNIDKVTIDNVDLMNGYEFERFITDLFRKMGYSVNQTKSSGDQGIDVLAVKRGQRIGIQAKCYSNNVSNKAIQEVVAGMNYYKVTKGIVITNNFFTNSAVELANSNGVVLWDRSILKEKIQEYY
jgi:HJR/Mrr/RecB family endonuclease